MKAIDPLAIAAGNRSYGSIHRHTVHQQKLVKRSEEYFQGSTVVGSLVLTAEELSLEELKEDVAGAHKFHGSIRDIDVVRSTGDLNSVTIYSSLAVKIAAEELKGNPDASAVIDCTGGLVSPIWISSASEMGRKALIGKNMGKRKISSDGKKVLIDVLNFHLALDLPTGPFVACEAVVVGKDARTFRRILEGFNEDLGAHGPNAQHIKYVVSDMALPFAIAVVDLYNKMDLPAYMATILFAAKADDRKIVSVSIRTFVIWCGVHADRAFRRHFKDLLDDKEKEEQEMLTQFFLNVRMAFVSAKSYKELCLFVGFMDRLLPIRRLCSVAAQEDSQVKEVVNSSELFKDGEQILWKFLGGVPERTDYAYLPTVKVKACQAKGYNPSYLEDSHTPMAAPDIHDDAGDDLSPTSSRDDQEMRSESESGDHGFLPETAKFDASSKGVVTYSFGPFRFYVVFRESDANSRNERYRVYIPSCSLLPNSIGGFTLWRSSDSIDSSIPNLAYIDGKSNAYLRRQWYPNMVLFCPCLIGWFPLSHNTPVELSYKIAKHHTDLGLLARQLSGLKVTEYVKRSSLSRRDQARNVCAELAVHSRLQRYEKTQKGKKRNSDSQQTSNGTKKRKTLDDIAKEVNPLHSNGALVKNVFIPKSRLVRATCEGTQNGNIPFSQQSQRDMAAVEETWCKRRRVRSMSVGEQENFRTTFREARKISFSSWSLQKIADFLSENALNNIGRKVDKSALSRICSVGGKLPGKELCIEIERYINEDLPRRTIEYENPNEFALMPGVELNVQNRLDIAPESFKSCLGDATVRMEDLRKLFRPSNSQSNDSSFWINDEVVNFMTNLSSMTPNLRALKYRNVFCFNSFFSSTVHDAWFGLNGFTGYSTQQKKEKLQRLLSKLNSTPRNGHTVLFSESTDFFAPCNVNENHWIGLQMNRSASTISCLDSLPPASEESIASRDRYGIAFQNFLSLADSKKWRYLGISTEYVRQPNSRDCGIIMLLAERSFRVYQRLEQSFITETNLSKWRTRFAHEILSSEMLIQKQFKKGDGLETEETEEAVKPL